MIFVVLTTYSWQSCQKKSKSRLCGTSLNGATLSLGLGPVIHWEVSGLSGAIMRDGSKANQNWAN
jgi:hypothetical protein